MSTAYVQVLRMDQYDGSNSEEVPGIAALMAAAGPGNGVMSVDDGVITISYPDFPGSFPVTINPTDWVTTGGGIFPAALIESDYLPFPEVA